MRVLIVEDEPTTAAIVQANLQNSGYTCDVADLGEVGLTLAETYGDYDIIILDLMLPDLKGQDILRQLRADGVPTPVLVLTGVRQLDVRRACDESGADDFLTKPFEHPELIARIDALLGRAHEPPAFSHKTH